MTSRKMHPAISKACLAGFTRDPSGIITSFAVPSAKFGTWPTAINNSGRITGQYEDANHQVHAFLR